MEANTSFGRLGFEIRGDIAKLKRHGVLSSLEFCEGVVMHLPAPESTGSLVLLVLTI